MSRYINKVVELFTKTKQSGTSVNEFHDWLVDGKQEEEKEKALSHLWNEPNSITKEQTLGSFAILSSKLGLNSKKRSVILWQYAAAIALLVCLTTAYVFTNKVPSEINFVEHFSPIGKVNSFTLPDGSVVQVNSSTVLVYPDNFGEDSRTLYLTGEANFKVVKNAEIPFVVKSKGFSVTALGTEFDVSSYPDDNMFRATLITGSVRVDEQGSNIGHVLSVGEQLTYNKETGETLRAMAELDDATAWQRGELVFRGATIQEITKVLARKYGVTFHNKSKQTDTDKYNFRFKKDSSLPDLMNVIKNVSDNFDYRIVDDVCYIY